MLTSRILKILLGSSAIGLFMTRAAIGADFNIPGGDLRTALNAYTAQTGVHLLYARAEPSRAFTRLASTARYRLMRLYRGF